MLRHQTIESVEMLGLLRRHVPDRVAGRGMAEHGKLSGIDPHSAVLAGVIDADHACDLVFLRVIAGKLRRWFDRVAHAAVRIVFKAPRPATPSATSEKMKLYPASDRPNNDHAMESQRMMSPGSKLPENEPADGKP